MSTLRSVLSRWLLAMAVLCGSFTFMGAAFAPFSPSFQGVFDPVHLDLSLELKTISGLVEAKASFLRAASLGRLEGMVLTYRAVSASA